MKRAKEWYRTRGTMQLLKNERIIREYRYNDIYQRRKILRIWNSEIKPDGVSCYELIIIPEIGADVR
jgi:hypothetical protein